MTHRDSLASISDDELFATVQHLTARANVALADLLAHLGEVERRGVHRLRACASLYAYCIYELRMSEDAAYRSSKAARLVREYPELGDAIAKGEIHLTGVLDDRAAPRPVNGTRKSSGARASGASASSCGCSRRSIRSPRFPRSSNRSGPRRPVTRRMRCSWKPSQDRSANCRRAGDQKTG